MLYKFDACGIGMIPLEMMNEENFEDLIDWGARDNTTIFGQVN